MVKHVFYGMFGDIKVRLSSLRELYCIVVVASSSGAVLLPVVLQHYTNDEGGLAPNSPNWLKLGHSLLFQQVSDLKHTSRLVFIMGKSG